MEPIRALGISPALAAAKQDEATSREERYCPAVAAADFDRSPPNLAAAAQTRTVLCSGMRSASAGAMGIFPVLVHARLDASGSAEGSGPGRGATPAWYPPEGFDLARAAAAAADLLAAQGALVPFGGATVDFTDVDCTLLQSNGRMRYVYDSDPQRPVLNPEDGEPLAVNFGPAGQPQHEELQLRRRFEGIFPIKGWQGAGLLKELRTAQEVLATKVIAAGFDQLRSDQQTAGHCTIVVTDSKLEPDAMQQLFAREKVGLAASFCASDPAILARLGLKSTLRPGQRKALLLAALLRAADPTGERTKCVRYLEDNDGILRDAMTLLPALFPAIRFEFHDVVHRGQGQHERVLVAASRDGQLFRPDGRPMSTIEVERYESKDAFYPTQGFMRRVEAGLPPGAVESTVRPPPPYPLVRIDAASFEPSGLAPDPADPTRLWVLNDRWDRRAHSLRLMPDNTLTPCGEEPGEISKWRPGAANDMEKFETCVTLPDGTLLAATPMIHGEPFQQHILRFRPGPGTIEPVLIAHDYQALAAEVERVTGQKEFLVEGLGVDGDQSHVFFGIRRISRGNHEWQDTVLIIRAPFDGARIGSPEASFLLDTIPVVGHQEGLSEIVRDPLDREGSYFVLTSHEAKDNTDPASHAGHLFRIPAQWLEGSANPRAVAARAMPAPLATFCAKPEGVARMADGRIVVIMDDDRKWKDLFAGYDRNKAAYAVLPGAAC